MTNYATQLRFVDLQNQMQAIIFAAMKALITFIAIAAVSVTGAGFYYVSSNSAKAESECSASKEECSASKEECDEKATCDEGAKPDCGAKTDCTDQKKAEDQNPT